MELDTTQASQCREKFIKKDSHIYAPPLTKNKHNIMKSKLEYNLFKLVLARRKQDLFLAPAYTKLSSGRTQTGIQEELSPRKTIF